MESVMRFFQDDPRMQMLLFPTAEDLAGLDRNLHDLRHMSSSPPPVAKGVAGYAGHPPELVFQYSATLISHSNPSYIQEGITLMENLVFQFWQEQRKKHELNEVNMESAGRYATAPIDQDDTSDEGEDDRARELRQRASAASLLPVYYYYIALGWTKLEDYCKARSSVDRMLLHEPDNRQGKALQAYLEHKQQRDGILGLVGLGTAVAAAAAIVALQLKR